MSIQSQENTLDRIPIIRKPVSKQKRRQTFEAYLLILPAVLFILLVYLFPIIKVVANSLFTIDGAQNTFVGIDNYTFILLKDEVFRTSLLNNVKLLAGIPIIVFLALILANFLYTQVKGWGIFRFIFIIPYILSITAIGITFDYILRENGLLNNILTHIGLGAFTHNWLGDPATAIYAILGAVVWKEFGFGVILFLARMMSINRQTIEASVVDGASEIQTLRYIIVPDMINVIVFYVIINMINFFSWMFNYVFVMTRGGPMMSTYVLEYYIYQTGIRYRQYGISAALAVITLLVAIIFVIAQTVIRSGIETQGEDG